MASDTSHVLLLRFSMIILPLLLTMMVAPTLQSPLTILDTPDGGTHPAPCALTCSGIGRWDATRKNRWMDSTARPGKSYKRVYISGCNFVSDPVLTLTTISPQPGVCPSVTVSGIYSDYFSVFTVEDSTAAEMKSKKCNIHWIAVGYNC